MADQLSTPISATDPKVAGLAAFQFLRGEFAEPTAHESEQLDALLYDLAPYSRTFRLAASGIRQRGNPEFRSVTIRAADSDCVNDGALLATCWLDEHGRFYFEA